MAKKDLYLELVKSSEFLLGEVRDREKIIWALKQTIAEEDLRFYFMLPFNISSSLPLSKLQQKAAKIGVSPAELQAALDRLYAQALVSKKETPEGMQYGRCPLTLTAEEQVRLHKGTPLGKAYADYWLDIATRSALNLPTKTPYLRVLPVESTIKKDEVEVGRVVPDPREVLPLDIISDLVSAQSLIGVSECYCRLARDMQGHVCEKPRETCFTFNDFAQSLIDIGVARKVEPEEARQILRECEKAGLIHNIDNYQGNIRTLCNCCSCCCPAMEAVRKGKKNVDAPSRYRVQFEADLCTHDYACVAICPVQAVTGDTDLPVFDAEKCIGCGLCASACPGNALHMVVREKAPEVLRSGEELTNRLMREAVIGMVVGKIFPPKNVQ